MENKVVSKLNAVNYPFRITSSDVDKLMFKCSKWDGDEQIGKALKTISKRWEDIRLSINDIVRERYETLSKLVGGYYRMTINPSSQYSTTHYIFLYKVLSTNSMMFYVSANNDIYMCGGLENKSMEFDGENLRSEFVFEEITEEEFIKIAHDGVDALMEHRKKRLAEGDPDYNIEFDF